MHFGSGEFTDNARVRQNIVPQSSRVQGFIREVRFTDFQQVKKGDTLVIIEDTEFRLRLAQAETDLLRAEQGSKGTASSIVATKTSMTVTEAGIESARAQMENAMREDNRFKNLLSQLPHIKVGNKVEITADAVPDVEYTGAVERISDATGSAFSLIPIDNATGNFVKVEQRVTVRIKLDTNSDVDKLKGGYNVECIVKE